MGFDVLKNISIKKVKHWIRKDLNQKFIEVVHELIISKEKNIQDQKKIAELEDEVRRLKGEQARPKFKGKKKIKKRDTSELDHDDDDEDPPAPKKKSIPVDKEIEVEVDQKDLPKDARFIGTTERVIQNLKIERKNIKFVFKRYYSPSLKKTFVGEIEGLDGSKFGGDLRALIDYLYFKLRVPHEKVREFLMEFEIEISKGQLCRMLNESRHELEEELEGARQASLIKSKTNHLDETGHKLSNLPLYTFCFSNIYMTFLKTFGRKTKADAMSTVFGMNEAYCFDHTAINYLASEGAGEKFLKESRKLFSNTVFTRASFFKLLEGLELSKPQQTKVKEAAMYGAYIKKAQGPPLKYLVTDDAKNLNFWRRHQLCWVHEIRKYKLLDVYGHSTIVDELIDEMRIFYGKLRAYRKSPCEDQKKSLTTLFNKIFTQKTLLNSVNEQLALTMKNKKKLLYVLEHPEVEIHNNLVERDIREKVIKQKISLFNQSWKGVRAWDLMLSLSGTCKKNGVSFFKFLLDRHNRHENLPYLGQLIAQS